MRSRALLRPPGYQEAQQGLEAEGPLGEVKVKFSEAPDTGEKTTPWQCVLPPMGTCGRVEGKPPRGALRDP